MGKKSPPPKAPDLTGITNAQLKIAEDSNELAREYLGLSREQYAYMQENAREELALAREQADNLFKYQQMAFDSGEKQRMFAEEVGRKQMEAMDLQMQYAKADRQRYESVTIPMQDRYIAEANNYDTEQRRESEASRAMVDIQRQAEAARTNSDMRLRSMGIDPSQMRSASLLDTQQVAMAAQQAGAANAARTSVEDRGRAMRADAINMVNGLPAQALAGFQAAGNSGAGAVNAGAAAQNATLGAISGGAGVGATAMGFRSGALNNLANLTGSPMQWAGMGGNMMGQAASTYGSAANTMSQDFQNRMSSWQAGQQQAQQGFQNIMSVASLAGGMMMAEGGEVNRERIDMARTPLMIDLPAADYQRINVSSADLGPGTMERIGGALAGAGGGSNDPGNVWAGQELNRPLLTRQTPLTQYLAEGGGVGPRGAIPVKQQRDKYPAMLGEGEYVIPDDVVRAVGLEKLDKMVAKYHRENA